MANALIFLKTIILPIFIGLVQCAIIPNPMMMNNIGDAQAQEEGFLELRPNGTLILRSTLENSPNDLQQVMLFKTILNAIRIVPTITGNTFNEIRVKIYGDGVEHKFPPFLENIIQRIQTYFSVYRYTETSEPLRDKNKPTLLNNETQYEEIDVNLSSDHINAVSKPNVSSSGSSKPSSGNNKPNATNKPSVSNKPVGNNKPNATSKPNATNKPNSSSNKPSANNNKLNSSSKPSANNNKPSVNNKPSTSNSRPNVHNNKPSVSSATTSIPQPLDTSEENEFIEIKKLAKEKSLIL